jgi:ribonucleoside-diphosphate reductase alpha chain
MDQILTTGSLQGVAGVPEEIRRVFVTSLNITAEDHILMQSVVQQHCCNAISKTMNFPNRATRDQIRGGFIDGWKRKRKGVTVYRNGSREFQVLETNAKKEDEPVETCSHVCIRKSSSQCGTMSNTREGNLW